MGSYGSTPRAETPSETDSKSLHPRLGDSMVPSRDSVERFVPTERLRTLLSEAVVARELEAEYDNPSQSEIKQIKDTARFASCSAFRTFATLCMAGNQHYFPLFHLAEFSDENLPITRQELAEKLKKMAKDTKMAHPRLSHSLDRRLDGVAETFSKDQWLFLAQSFDTDTFAYSELEKERLLPFLTSDPPIYWGTFSTVWERVLHKDHLTFGLQDKKIPLTVPMKKLDTTQEEHPWLALKELKHSPEDLYEITGTNMTEAQILKIMNDIGHPHLLHTFAHYRRDDKEYFLFPWAERGSLRKYWEKTTPNPTPDYVMWLVAQMAGLSDAVSALHSKKCRHGDLKPDNILCFGGQKKNDAAENIVLPPDRLVVGDLGLAKIHEFITALRANVATKTKAGTLMYSPPEYEQGGTAPWSRLFDIWSLGCIYLEFMVWFLHGNDVLREFSQSVGPNGGEKNTFYTIIEGDGTTEARLAVHPTVTRWVDKLLGHPLCGASTALRRVIRLIADEMIVVAIPPEGAADGREMAGVHEEMKRSQASGSSQTGQLPTFRIHAATTIEAQDKERVRATARSVSDKLTNLLTEMKKGVTQAMTLPPPDDPNQPPPAKPAQGSPTGNRGKGTLDVPVRRKIPSAFSGASTDR